MRLVTTANALSLSRPVAAPFLAAAVVAERELLAIAIFGLAVASDLADGRVARRRGQTSPLGGLLDHASDALFVSVGLAALAWRGEVPALLPAFVLLAFLQYASDSRSGAGRLLRPSALGRCNGIAYFVLLGVPIVRDALSLSQPRAALVRALGWALLASTVASMLSRAGTRRPGPKSP